MLLTVEQFREHVTSGLGDDALQRLLDAGEAEIVRYAGSSSASEVFDGRARYLTLSRPVDTITSIVETWWDTDTTLAADDYLVRSPFVLERLRTGTNPHSNWWGRVTVNYVPADDEDIRIGVLIDLITLMESYAPGTTTEQIGAWTETRSNSAAWNNSDERAAILGRLDPGPSLIVV